jgi:hypothetical protein
MEIDRTPFTKREKKRSAHGRPKENVKWNPVRPENRMCLGGYAQGLRFLCYLLEKIKAMAKGRDLGKNLAETSPTLR